MNIDDDERATLTKMTKDEHDDFASGGCDPHCHACDRKINVGDWWGLKTFVPSGQVSSPTGLFVGTVRGTACETCIKEDRGLSPEELTNLHARLRAAMVKPKPEPKPEASTGARHGCFVLEDGRRF